MRIDKFLKVSRVIKRRTIAKNVGESEKIKINGNVKKPGTQVKEGDIIELEYYNNYIKFKILSIPLGNVSKEKSNELIEMIESR